MSLISLAVRTQEPVQESHSRAHIFTLGKRPSQKSPIRIRSFVRSFTVTDHPLWARHGPSYWRNSSDQGRWIPGSHTPILTLGKSDKLSIRVKHLFTSAELRIRTYRDEEHQATVFWVSGERPPGKLT